MEDIHGLNFWEQRSPLFDNSSEGFYPKEMMMTLIAYGIGGFLSPANENHYQYEPDHK